ncbi:cathepsin l [Stylonychia lemnae]|uniref:Cathepsin l n=1 Tax=Stylonychia lemnae TaxID=5949 RepID=A0A078A9T0_STYLE|nr:cathepsin l [Stylonychia lemnae]|eukprot:CDW78651.1 cathepsin l [Stylonychia lemnae]
MARHGKSYATKEEYELRLKQYRTSMSLINSHNSNNAGGSFHLKPNKFADYTPQEYKKLLGFRPVAKTQKTLSAQVNASDIPDSIDWRTKGAVNAVKDQGQCGSCWAFSTVGALEGRNFIKTGKLFSLSEQQLVDCARDGSAGCEGGDMGSAMDYIAKNPLETEANYPYAAVDQTCQADPKKEIVTDLGHNDITPNSVAALKAAIAQGPVSVAIEADTFTFQFYSGGVLNSSGCGTNLDHGVVAVGYGKENNQEYYIVRNSWGPSWGESGYIRIAAVEGAGICGIQMQPVAPKL